MSSEEEYVPEGMNPEDDLFSDEDDDNDAEMVTPPQSAPLRRSRRSGPREQAKKRLSTTVTNPLDLDGSSESDSEEPYQPKPKTRRRAARATRGSKSKSASRSPKSPKAQQSKSKSNLKPKNLKEKTKITAHVIIDDTSDEDSVTVEHNTPSTTATTSTVTPTPSMSNTVPIDELSIVSPAATIELASSETDDTDDSPKKETAAAPPLKRSTNRKRKEPDSGLSAPPKAKRAKATKKSSAATTTAASASSTSTSTAKKSTKRSKKDAKPVALKGDAATQKIRAYMKKENRPFNAKTIKDNMGGTIGLAAVKKSLQSLVKSAEVSTKTFNKTELFWWNQSDLPSYDNEELQSKQTQCAQLKKRLAALRNEESELKLQIKKLSASPTDEKLDTTIEDRTNELEVKKETLERKRNSANVISAEEINSQILHLYQYLKAWKERKSAAMDMIDKIWGEGSMKPKDVIRKTLNSETDEDCKINFDDWKDLFTEGTLAFRKAEDEKNNAKRAKQALVKKKFGKK